MHFNFKSNCLSMSFKLLNIARMEFGRSDVAGRAAIDACRGCAKGFQKGSIGAHFWNPFERAQKVAKMFPKGFRNLRLLPPFWNRKRSGPWAVLRPLLVSPSALAPLEFYNVCLAIACINDECSGSGIQSVSRPYMSRIHSALHSFMLYISCLTFK